MLWDYLNESRYRDELKREKGDVRKRGDLKTQQRKRETRSLIVVGVLLLISMACLVLSFTML